jgi:enamine deaminase RidA (YjgF/YER057c/UK114 family)
MAKTIHPTFNPSGAPKPFSTYSAMVELDEQRRTFHVSGQVGVTPEGELAGDGEAQMRQAWMNVLAVLKGAGLGPEHLVKVVAYITTPDLVPVYRVERDAALAGAAPASTLVGVPFLAHPDWLVEIEAIAAV